MNKTTSQNQLWFLDSLVTIRVPSATGPDGISVLEHRVPHGSSPPLHVHRTEDELFYVLEGEMRMKVQDKEQRIGPGTLLLAPKGIPHTYRAESPGGAHFLTTTVRGDFERFIFEMSCPAERPELPKSDGPPPPEAIKHLATVAAKHGIEFVGPPLQ